MLPSEGATEGHVWTQERDEYTLEEGTNTLSVEVYYSKRMLGMLREFTAQSRELAVVLKILEFLLFSIGTLASILAALQHTVYVPVCVALTGALTSYMQQHARHRG